LGITGALVSQATSLLPEVHAASVNTTGGSGSGTMGYLSYFTSSSDIENSNIVYYPSPGLLAIGPFGYVPSTPNAALSFGSSFNTSGSGATNLIYLFDGAGAAKYGLGISTGELRIYCGADLSTNRIVFGKFDGSTFTEWMRVNNSGYVGIGTTTPSVALDVAGEAHAADFVATSDMRFKEEVVPIDNALDKVLRLQGVYFKWNQRYRDTLKGSNTNRRQIGVVAQQVVEVIPEVVSGWNDQEDEYLAVDCGRLTAVTIEAVKEQQKQIRNLLERISTLEEHVKKLTSS
jgi:ribosomal protein S15P/S13E